MILLIGLEIIILNLMVERTTVKPLRTTKGVIMTGMEALIMANIKTVILPIFTLLFSVSIAPISSATLSVNQYLMGEYVFVIPIKQLTE